MKRIQSTDKLYPFRFFEIRPSPTHFKIGEQILQYISYVYAKFYVDWRSTYREIPVSKFIRGSPVTVPIPHHVLAHLTLSFLVNQDVYHYCMVCQEDWWARSRNGRETRVCIPIFTYYYLVIHLSCSNRRFLCGSSNSTSNDMIFFTYISDMCFWYKATMMKSRYK